MNEANIAALLVNGGGFAVIGLLLWKLVSAMMVQNKEVLDQNRALTLSQTEQNKSIATALTNHLQHQLLMQEKHNEYQSEIQKSLVAVVSIMTEGKRAGAERGKALHNISDYLKEKLP